MRWRALWIAVSPAAALALAAAGTATCGGDATGSEHHVLLWRFPAHRGVTTPLVMDDQIVFAGDDGLVIAVDRTEGTERWERQLPPGVFWGNVLVSAAGLVIAPQYELWGLDAEDGRVRWHFGGPDGQAGTHDPAAAGDTVFAAGGNGWVSKLDASTGEALWSVDLGESAFQPALSDELVIYATRGFMGQGERQGPLGAGHIVALHRIDGSEAWRFPLPDSAGFPLSGGGLSGGVVWQDRVIVGAITSRAYALRLTDGSVIWAKASGASPVTSRYRLRPSVIQDIVILIRQDDVVEARDVRSGDLKWTVSHPTGLSTPATAGGYVYIVDGPATITDVSGTVVWSYGGADITTLGPVFWSGTASAEGIIYTLGNEQPFADTENYLWALEPPVKP